MTTSTELRRIVGAMTERPWFQDSESPTSGFRYVHVGDANGPGQTVAQWTLPQDATAIAALANHADALVALVEAVERESAALSAFAARNGAAYANTAKAIESVLGALAAVHAVKP